MIWWGTLEAGEILVTIYGVIQKVKLINLKN